MIAYQTRIGTVEISSEYLTKLIGKAVSSCYGVTEMVPQGTQKIRNFFFSSKSPEKGIKIQGDIDSITVTLHIVVSYGMNINAIANSIAHKVKYTVFEATGITVNKVTVKIDGIKE